MFGLPPLTPKEIATDAATNIIGDKILDAISKYEAGDNAGAAGDLGHVIAVTAAYAAGTLYGFGTKFALSGLSQAISLLSKDPSLAAKILLNSGIIKDALVAERLANVGKGFTGGASAAYLTDKAIQAAKNLNIGIKIYDLIHPNAPWKDKANSISNAVRDFFNWANKWRPNPRRDPLTFDLNGNGLDTVGINASNPILFDHDADGIKTATGWVKAEDGFLVLDRSGNGTIDNGTELFGDSTPLNGGGKAVDGFAALAQQDTNADGKVNNQDTNWNQLRVWRDLNQDGISQGAELLTLAALNIASINVASTNHSAILANGNQIADLGTYTKTNGALGDLGEVGDVNLAEDTFTSQFTDHIPLANGVSALPNMSGAGQVRNIQEAASIDSAAGRTLKAMLTAYASATHAGQKAMLDDLIVAWAATNQRGQPRILFPIKSKLNHATSSTH